MENTSSHIKVELLNPPLQDPWRTRAEYIEEQNLQKWQFRLTILALVFSIIASIAAVASAYAAIQALKQVPVSSISTK